MSTLFVSQTQYGKNEDFSLQVGRRQISGHESVFLFGYSASITNAAFIPAWENTAAYTYPASAVAMSIVSTSASDTAVEIIGCDEVRPTRTIIDASKNSIVVLVSKDVFITETAFRRD
jgi:hypothetical protein